MDVVFVASEAVPFAQTGGLADVIGSLPAALNRLGVNVSLVLPCYREVWWRSGQEIESTGHSIRVDLSGRSVQARVLRSELPHSRVPVYLIDQPCYFDRDQLYTGPDGRDFPDNAERFAFFCRAALEWLSERGPAPDVIHVHDWQAGLIPAELSESYRERFPETSSLLTVHNLAYQGLFDPSILPLTGLDPSDFAQEGVEFYGRVSYLKAGLVRADRLSTVSPTYAREIQTLEYGCGLDGVLRSRAADLRGIVNGIDSNVWNPAREPMLARRYTVDDVEEGKAACKRAIQEIAGLPQRPDVPLFAQIGRLDPQKGWDLVLAVADDLLRADVQFLILAQGQPRFHAELQRLALRYPGNLRIFLEFSQNLAHQIEAGADLFLMPSLYEPCGLNQLYSLAHGTIPIVRATGGLADTVVDANPTTLSGGTATGIVFQDPTPEAFLRAIERAVALWRDRPQRMKVITNGMRADWSWDRSAREYLALYDEMSRSPRCRRESRSQELAFPAWR
ncbi:MAG: glycogen synthase GlgA [Isosphaeraceae bacterium]